MRGQDKPKSLREVYRSDDNDRPGIGGETFMLTLSEPLQSSGLLEAEPTTVKVIGWGRKYTKNNPLIGNRIVKFLKSNNILVELA